MTCIVSVNGEVLVDDALRKYSQMAASGLWLDATGNYLIATTATSSATVMINGKMIILGPSSFLRVRGDRSWWDSHHETWNKDFRLFIGRLWARVANDPRDEDVNAAVGVRG